jgi:hypothetical protein
MDAFELILAGGLLIVVALMLMIIKALQDRPHKGTDNLLASSDSVPEKTNEPESQDIEEEIIFKQEGEPESERDRLSRLERELQEKYDQVKSEKIRELEEREKLMSNSMNPPKKSDEAQAFTSEKAKIQSLIRKAEESYETGELEEENFKKIVSDYQSHIVELDIKIKRIRDGKIT